MQAEHSIEHHWLLFRGEPAAQRIGGATDRAPLGGWGLAGLRTAAGKGGSEQRGQGTAAISPIDPRRLRTTSTATASAVATVPSESPRWW